MILVAENIIIALAMILGLVAIAYFVKGTVYTHKLRYHFKERPTIGQFMLLSLSFATIPIFIRDEWLLEKGVELKHESIKASRNMVLFLLSILLLAFFGIELLKILGKYD